MTIKKGTTVILHFLCNFVGCEGEEEFTLDRDMTEDELNQLAYEQAVEYVQPEGFFKLKEED